MDAPGAWFVSGPSEGFLLGPRVGQAGFIPSCSWVQLCPFLWRTQLLGIGAVGLGTQAGLLALTPFGSVLSPLWHQVFSRLGTGFAVPALSVSEALSVFPSQLAT